MSHTNSTTNYSLPQFVTSDKPAWLTDVNNAYTAIDTGMYNAQTKANTADTNASQALLDASSAASAASAADAKGAGALASIETAFDATSTYSVGARVIYNSLLYRCIVAVTTPGAWTGSDNWERITVDNLISATDSKIGLLTSLSTTDKNNLVSAVNEVNGKFSDLVPKSATQSSVTVPANSINTIVLSASNAVYKHVVGVYISGDNVVPIQFYFSSNTEITVRLRNLSGTAYSCNVDIRYI